MSDPQPTRTGWPKSLAEYIGWKDLGVRDGVYRGSIQVRPEHLAPNGYLQAAVVVALADICCASGTFSTIPEDGALPLHAARPAPERNVRGMGRAGVILLAAIALGAGARAQETAQEHIHEHPAAPAPEALEPPAEPDALEQATEALDRFNDVEVAKAEGYRKPWHNDGFMMGEHWFRSDLLYAMTCDLERPEFLQYLVIEGERTLIGVGYVCDGAGPAPDWFGPEAVWHQHGPELCRFRSGVFADVSYLAQALPNPLNDETWQDVCESWWGEPERREVTMLHTWNWMARPDGPFVHENRAIPFLRAGLRVPTREELDAPAGRAALDTLRLASGDAFRRYSGAFQVANLGRFDTWGVHRVLRRAQRHARLAVDRMRAADKVGDRNLWAAAARDGGAAFADMQTEIAESLGPEERAVVQRFLASLVVHDHHTDDEVE